MVCVDKDVDENHDDVDLGDEVLTMALHGCVNDDVPLEGISYSNKIVVSCWRSQWKITSLSCKEKKLER